MAGGGGGWKGGIPGEIRRVTGPGGRGKELCSFIPGLPGTRRCGLQLTPGTVLASQIFFRFKVTSAVKDNKVPCEGRVLMAGGGWRGLVSQVQFEASLDREGERRSFAA